jgi:hypothetical protein
MSPYPVSREGWPQIYLHPSEFAAADRAGYVERQSDRMVLRVPGIPGTTGLGITAVIHIVRPIP